MEKFCQIWPHWKVSFVVIIKPWSSSLEMENRAIGKYQKSETQIWMKTKLHSFTIIDYWGRSVTRWRYYFSKFGHLQGWKLAQKHKNRQIRVENLPDSWQTPRKWPNGLKYFFKSGKNSPNLVILIVGDAASTFISFQISAETDTFKLS